MLPYELLYEIFNYLPNCHLEKLNDDIASSILKKRLKAFFNAKIPEDVTKVIDEITNDHENGSYEWMEQISEYIKVHNPELLDYHIIFNDLSEAGHYYVSYKLSGVQEGFLISFSCLDDGTFFPQHEWCIITYSFYSNGILQLPYLENEQWLYYISGTCIGNDMNDEYKRLLININNSMYPYVDSILKEKDWMIVKEIPRFI